MRLTTIISLCALTLTFQGTSHAAERVDTSQDEVRVVPVKPTPDSETVETRIVFPQTKDIQTKNPVDIQLRVEGFPMRTYSEFPRAREVMNYNVEGQSIHIIVDNEPYFAENEAIVDALDNAMDYYDQVMEFPMETDLEPGMHVLRVFPARSYGESVKSDGAFMSRIFYFRSKTPLLDVDLSKPYLTPNQPQGNYKYDPKKPILFDFYLSNVLLSKDGYKLRITIDGKIQRIITSWVPYYIYGLKPGDHVIKMELLNEKNTQVPGMFNNVERKFSIR